MDVLPHIGEAAPEVDHRLAFQGDATGSADVCTTRQIRFESIAHSTELIGHESVDRVFRHSVLPWYQVRACRVKSLRRSGAN